MPDSIQHNIDTISPMKTDSLSILDSSNVQDSLAMVDTLKAIVAPIPSGMEGIALPSFPSNENWVFIVIAALFIFLVTGIIQSAGTFVQNFKSFFSRKETVNLIVTPTANIAYFQILITIFTISVFALLSYEAVFVKPYNFNFTTFLLFSGAFALFYIVKHILFEIVGNTFFNRKITRNYKNMYFSLLNVLAIIVFPILILNTYQPVEWENPLKIIGLIFAGLFYIFLIIKIFQIFFTKPIALFYIFLYLCTLEILPILYLIRLSQKFI